ncbi:DNA repair protein RAD50 [Nosema bombycis CQ1]|uniref:DNA repair protein RAD50 n=1 Tax=Nosema bombycis (strain CQ1 / CVCC 102059) TaxID=578461 RepID=R0KV29_NOSB1|nr:DNA repair protein RAD50 [Nosema bombycis CQ1]|eukprot:EOB14731.1 DNA repair protein RAD50 [Nosema bombycis CQ1]
MNQLQINKSQIQKELDLEFKNIIKDYNKSYVSHKILDLSLKDLDKLILSLDKAILDFHSFKIKEVNKILKDLWISSYKGNDIDFIELKSESLSNKTYSYRINQIKNNVELEMRGRCSAGQKMLASILVRLALSQTFGINFNYLALDEPTTNLDKENIESLGNSLLKIIKESKIQLIVITHDEEFVSILGRESGEYFYRLSRNERGDSVIHRHSVY